MRVQVVLTQSLQPLPHQAEAEAVLAQIQRHHQVVQVAVQAVGAVMHLTII
jgi:hypothetical protein